MKWSSERYTRLYTRDTSNWVSGPWQARAVLPLVLRKLDRAGMLELDDNGLDGLAAMLGLPVEVVESGMAWWTKKGTLVVVGTTLTMPNYIEAQECVADGALRTADWRDRKRRDETSLTRDAASPPSDEASLNVTNGDGARRRVTARDSVPCRAVPSRAVLSLAVPEEPDLPSVDPAPTGIRLKTARAVNPRSRTVVPADWQPTPGTIARFAEQGVDATAHVGEFVDYWRGEGTPKADWDATFRNRVRALIDAGRAKALPPQAMAVPVLTGFVTDGPERAKALLAGLGTPRYFEKGKS